jgi:hypothetical protein
MSATTPCAELAAASTVTVALVGPTVPSPTAEHGGLSAGSTSELTWDLQPAATLAPHTRVDIVRCGLRSVVRLR